MAVIKDTIDIKAAARKVIKAAKKGAIAGGLLIRREGMKQTPVDTGNLIGSWYGPVVKAASIANKVLVQFGLTAAYAPFVHEKMGVTFRKPGAKSKFLEDPLKAYTNRVLIEIAEEIKKVTK